MKKPSLEKLFPYHSTSSRKAASPANTSISKTQKQINITSNIER